MQSPTLELEPHLPQMKRCDGVHDRKEKVAEQTKTKNYRVFRDGLGAVYGRHVANIKMVEAVQHRNKGVIVVELGNIRNKIGTI